ncbi:hypothetical protein, partial [Pseudomonas syringae group genomosp. 7]|uniref:hypothetical protein n=1 Tax=Pseudomonas syringae group genomosp. 7 TaxID=251699 RepID=UPI00376F8065
WLFDLVTDELVFEVVCRSTGRKASHPLEMKRALQAFFINTYIQTVGVAWEYYIKAADRRQLVQ